jgi:catechol 2,3-dioxygenase-like lactoylglutathione lyase family enzyme
MTGMFSGLIDITVRHNPGKRALFRRLAIGALVSGAILGGAASRPALADVGPATELDSSGIVLANVTISVSDLGRSSKFYQALGFELGDVHPIPPMLGKLLGGGDKMKAEIQFLRRNGVVVELVHIEPAPKGKPSHGVASALGLAHIAFRVDDVDRVVGIIKSNGGAVLEETRTKLGSPGKGNEIVFCTDPDGVRLEIAGPLKG